MKGFGYLSYIAILCMVLFGFGTLVRVIMETQLNAIAQVLF